MNTTNTLNDQAPARPLSRSDFTPRAPVRWCPGCGSYSILNAILGTLPTLGIPRENVVFVSGIGCSSRLPFYAETYGFHTLHGRAPTIASGLKVSRPELSVWLVTGDGDALSIGGNHTMHLLRRNLDIKVLLFNNQIYGLTKGQHSPTSPAGKASKSSPEGIIDSPISPISLALGVNASLVARCLSSDKPGLEAVIRRASQYRGTAFIEILQNCPIFNDGAFNQITDKEVRDEHQLHLVDGQPLIFGPGRNKGLRWNAEHQAEVVELGNGVTEQDLIIHCETLEDPLYAIMLSRLALPAFQVPLGILRAAPRPCYDGMLNMQVTQAQADLGNVGLNELFRGFGKVETWKVG